MKFDKWKIMIESNVSADRVEAADTIPDTDSEEFLPILFKTLDDKEPLVRVCALDSLRFFEKESVIKIVINHLEQETNDLAKAHGLSTLGNIGGIAEAKILINAIQNSNIDQIRLNGIFGLYSCTQRVAMTELFSYLENGNSKIRAASANMISEIVENDIKMISNALKQLKIASHEESILGNQKSIEEDLSSLNSLISELKTSNSQE